MLPISEPTSPSVKWGKYSPRGFKSTNYMLVSQEMWFSATSLTFTKGNVCFHSTFKGWESKNIFT